MKHLLPLIFVTLLLAGCTSQGSTKMTDDQIFQKKQECAGYKDEIHERCVSGSGCELKEIFYSPVKNTCIIYAYKFINEKDGGVHWLQDQLTNQEILSYWDNQDNNAFLNKIKELKGE